MTFGNSATKSKSILRACIHSMEGFFFLPNIHFLFHMVAFGRKNASRVKMNYKIVKGRIFWFRCLGSRRIYSLWIFFTLNSFSRSNDKMIFVRFYSIFIYFTFTVCVYLFSIYSYKTVHSICNFTTLEPYLCKFFNLKIGFVGFCTFVCLIDLIYTILCVVHPWLRSSFLLTFMKGQPEARCSKIIFWSFSLRVILDCLLFPFCQKKKKMILITSGWLLISSSCGYGFMKSIFCFCCDYPTQSIRVFIFTDFYNC